MHKQYSNRQHHLIVVRNQFWWVWPRLFWRFCSFLFAFKTAKIPFQTMAMGVNSPWWSKKELAQEIHASRGSCEMHANQFWWVWPRLFWGFCSFFCLQNGQNSLSVHGDQKIELARKFMQVEVVVKCMQISFGGHGLSSIGDFALFLFACKIFKIPYRNIHLKKYIYILYVM